MNHSSRTDDNLSIVIAAGGTGGHVFPALAIAKAVRRHRPGATITFVGTRDRMESRVVPQAGFDIRYIWISGFHRRLTIKNLLFPVKLIVSLMQSLHLLLNINPSVVLSCGGYVAGPVGWIATMLQIPLVLQEQNSYPGVTNRMLSKRARRIYTAFEEAHDHLPSEKSKLVGNPTRQNLSAVDRNEALSAFDFSADRRTILVMGGSGGARTINEAVLSHLDTLHDELELQIIWICGKNYEENIRRRIDVNRYSRLRLYKFLDDIDQAYGAADLVVSRAGASTCAELQLTGNASVLVPSPNVAGDHQRKNARAMVSTRAAIMIEDHELEKMIVKQIKKILADENLLREMQEAAQKLSRPNAADVIAKDIINLSSRT